MQISRYLRYAIAALGMCFGTFAYAAADPVTYGHTLRHVVADVGAYGAECAQFKAEQSFVMAGRITHSASTAGLVKNSHGFLQTSANEVAKGTTGNTVSLSLS